MLRSIIRTRTARFPAVAGALLALTAGGAYATGVLGSPSAPDGVIHGCYQKFNGSLRLVAADDPACRASEQPIAWSETGPKGEQGEPGAKGDAGPEGDPGRTAARAGATTATPGRPAIGAPIVSRTSRSLRALASRTPVELRRRRSAVSGGAWRFIQRRRLRRVVPRLLIQTALIDRHREVKIDITVLRCVGLPLCVRACVHAAS